MALLWKMICNLGDPMSLRHPVHTYCFPRRRGRVRGCWDMRIHIHIHMASTRASQGSWILHIRTHVYIYPLHESKEEFAMCTHSYLHTYDIPRKRDRVRDLYIFAFTYIWHSTRARQSSWNLYIRIHIHVHMAFYESEIEFFDAAAREGLACFACCLFVEGP